jgi:hypothetical protein
VETADFRGVARELWVNYLSTLPLVFGDSLERKTMWSKIGAVIIAAIAKTRDGDLSQFHHYVLEGIQSELSLAASEARTGIFSGVGTATDAYYKIAGTWYTHTQIFGSAAASIDDVRCPFNHTNIVLNGKNCCYGTYSLRTISYDGTDTTIDTTATSWGGSHANCFEGPGISESEMSGKMRPDGLPYYWITNVDSDAGLVNTFSVTAPILMTAAGRPQVYAASYYSSADHVANTPDMPESLATIRLSSLGYDESSVNGSAYFQYDCLDPAYEIVSRIRIQAREWNLASQLAALIDTGTGNSNSTGTETPPTQSDSDSVVPDAHPNNDFSDWKDLSTAGLSGLSAYGLSGASATTITPTYSANEGYLGFPIGQ